MGIKTITLSEKTYESVDKKVNASAFFSNYFALENIDRQEDDVILKFKKPINTDKLSLFSIFFGNMDNLLTYITKRQRIYSDYHVSAPKEQDQSFRITNNIKYPVSEHSIMFPICSERDLDDVIKRYRFCERSLQDELNDKLVDTIEPLREDTFFDTFIYPLRSMLRYKEYALKHYPDRHDFIYHTDITNFSDFFLRIDLNEEEKDDIRCEEMFIKIAETEGGVLKFLDDKVKQDIPLNQELNKEEVDVEHTDS